MISSTKNSSLKQQNVKIEIRKNSRHDNIYSRIKETPKVSAGTTYYEAEFVFGGIGVPAVFVFVLLFVCLTLFSSAL